MNNNMKKIILFSIPTKNNTERINRELFPDELRNKVFAYMPSDGNDNPKKFTNHWKGIAREHNAEFLYINNAVKDIKKEIQKLALANILLITGGNTFGLLHRLKNTGLDKAILEFTQKENFIIAGFSAGAIVLTPNIEVCNIEKFDSNIVSLKDLTGLGIVNFEIFPHYNKRDEKILQNYLKTSKNEIRRISDDDYIIQKI
jgi:dipeptidase E